MKKILLTILILSITFSACISTNTSEQTNKAHTLKMISTGSAMPIKVGAAESTDNSTTKDFWPIAGIEPTTGMEFVKVPGGCFNMGNNAGEFDEKPVHEVCVDGFYMAKYEVTNWQYRLYKTEHDSKDYKGISLNGDSQPAVYVSWEDAVEFAEWLSRKTGKIFRLPTEAEWEYAARAGSTTTRFWGDDPDLACLYGNVSDQAAERKWTNMTFHNCEDGYAVTGEVGSFMRNKFGLYDMLGNVWEWTNDEYDGSYYSSSPRDNPKGPASGLPRVFRGGSWFYGPRYVRSSIRSRHVPGHRSDDIGFRLLLLSGK